MNPDTKTPPLPWVEAAVLVRDEAGVGTVEANAAQPPTERHATRWCRAEPGEQGDVVILRPLPHMGMTVWSPPHGTQPDASGRGDAPCMPAHWRGNLTRWRGYFVPFEGRWAFVQGDVAVRHQDGRYSFHGRSDEVINVGGVRIGTEEVENALLADRRRGHRSPLRNAVVVGVPNPVLGTAPCAFIVPEAGAAVDGPQQSHLRALVGDRLGGAAVPRHFVVLSELPETHSGKYMRRVLRALMSGEPLGDTATLRNPGCLLELRAATSVARAADGTGSQALGVPLPRLLGPEALARLQPRQLRAVALRTLRAMDGSGTGGGAGETAGNGETSDEGETDLAAPDGDAAQKRGTQWDSMAVLHAHAAQLPPTDVVLAHLYATCMLLVVFHHSVFADGKVFRSMPAEARGASLWLDTYAGSRTGIVMPAFALLAGVHDLAKTRDDGGAGTGGGGGGGGGGARAAAATAARLAAMLWLINYSNLPYVAMLVHDKVFEIKKWPLPYARLVAPAWFLFALLVWRLLAAGAARLRVRYAPPLLATLAHFLCFGDGCPYPFKRWPLNKPFTDRSNLLPRTRRRQSSPTCGSGTPLFRTSSRASRTCCLASAGRFPAARSARTRGSSSAWRGPPSRWACCARHASTRRRASPSPQATAGCASRAFRSTTRRVRTGAPRRPGEMAACARTGKPRSTPGRWLIYGWMQRRAS